MFQHDQRLCYHCIAKWRRDICNGAVLSENSAYFAGLLGGAFAEALSRRVELLHLDPDAVKSVVAYLQNGFADRKHDAIVLEQNLDYLQIEPLTISQAISILNDPLSVRHECIKQGYIVGSKYHLPVGKKKRSWRFWVCYLLSLDILPNDAGSEQRMDRGDNHP